MSGRINLRAAKADDQKMIRKMVCRARINPIGIHWPDFIIAESEGQIVGIGQVKQHRDGSRELASIAVRPAYQRQGIATAIIHELISNEEGVLYLTCRAHMEDFYKPFGFYRVTGDDLSGYMAFLDRLNRYLEAIVSLFRDTGPLGIIMRRERPEMLPSQSGGEDTW
jgi:N-acetylglutamate synthase-like GNAT family acetyltransferase